MAVDTKHKRMNMLAFAGPIPLVQLYEQDGAGTIDGNDRAHLLHLYGGNALAGSVPKFELSPLNQTHVFRRVRVAPI